MWLGQNCPYGPIFRVFSTITAAEFFVDLVGADGTGIPMNPTDGTFDSPTEGVTVSGDPGLPPGNYTLFVHGRDSAGNWGGTDSVVLTVTAAPDNTGPVTSGVAVSPNPTGGATAVTLTATVDDSTTGGSAIAAAEYFIDVVGADGTGIPMNPTDGTFNSPTEGVTFSGDLTGSVA